MKSITSGKAPAAAMMARGQAIWQSARERGKGWFELSFQILLGLLALYLFIAAINLMGTGLKTVAQEPASDEFMKQLFNYASHPLAGLCVGLLITSLVQSSSFTTSFTVGLVATGRLELVHAIPIIMGANIGTSITNILVSLANIRRRQEFQRSLGGAIVHDFFNVLSVLVFLPLEWKFKIISAPAGQIGNWLGSTAFFETSPEKFNFVKIAVKPVTSFCKWFFLDVLNFSPTVGGLLIAGVAIAMLFVALIFMVKILQGLLKDRLSGLFSKTLFRNPGIAFVVGIITTAAVQSSSVTTSLVVPLVGAGVLTLNQIYPYTLGANIGTTITAIFAGLAAAALAAGQGEAAQARAISGMAVAGGHLLFNIYGTCLFWPLKWIPISLAEGFAAMATRRRLLAAVYILVIFFILPISVISCVNYFNLN